MLDPATAAVPVVRRPSREQFLHEFYAANRPVLIEGAMDDWPAMTEWTMEKLKRRFGERTVEVQAGPERRRQLRDQLRQAQEGDGASASTSTW